MFQKDDTKRESFTQLKEYFPLDRILTVVGTNYRTYKVSASSLANRLFSISGEFGPTYNRSDGLVKQQYAQIPEAPRTFIHKCHGGFDSLVTARESFEVATRFFFGVSIKPRRVDFELFHQSAEAENCYGPFHKDDLSDDKVAFSWAGPDRLIWEGYLDTSSILEDKSITVKDMVMRLDVYLGERDIYGVGFSDNVIFRKHYYLRALLNNPFTMYIHADERFAQPDFQTSPSDEMRKVRGGWEFKVKGTGFEATLRVEFDQIPIEGLPV
ncbi:MAG: PGAP1-like protein [Nitrosospira multiformis]|nr:PGAP1-like protein [Nitrosospira multiformis]